MKLLFVLFITWLIQTQSYAIEVHSVVYRTDNRNIHEILLSGGMWPWHSETVDYDLTHHFEGESLEEQTSAFVSTSSSIASVVQHAASLARPNSEFPFDEDYLTYIYTVRPNNNFYDVQGSLRIARDNAPLNSQRRNRLERLLRDYTGMEEIVAVNGFSSDRIVEYAVLTGAMLNQYGIHSGSPLLSDVFWAERWRQEETVYNHQYNSDTSNLMPYNMIDIPTGIRSVVVNGTQPEVPLSFTCFGVNSNSHLSKRDIFLKKKPSCTKYEIINIHSLIYDKGLLYSLIENYGH